ncbi:MAG: hypothetical protein ABIH66_11385 [bacterium]
MLNATAYRHLLNLDIEGFPKLLLSYHFIMNDKALFASRIEADFPVVAASIGESTITDHIQYEDGFLTVRRKWNIAGEGDARLLFYVQCRLVPVDWMVPSVIYNGNGASRKRFPRRGAELGMSFLEDRCAAPALSFVQSGEHSLGVFTTAAATPQEVSSVQTFSSGAYTGVSISNPGVESSGEPAGIRLARLLSQPEHRRWKIEGHLTYERTFYIPLGTAGPRAARAVLRKAWGTLAFEPSTLVDWSDYATQKAFHLAHHFFIERADTIGFVESLSRNLFPKKATLLGGGRGGNVEAAYNLYRVAVEAGMPALKRIALDTADFFLSGFEEPGAFSTAYRLGTRRWTGDNRGRHSQSFLSDLSTMMESYVRFNRATAELQDANPRWMVFCKRAAELIMGSQQKNGAFLTSPPQTLAGDRDGSLLTAFAAPPLAALYRETGENACLDRARRAADFLLAAAAPRSYADPDSGMPSREIATAAMRALLEIFRETEEEKYLRGAEAAGDFLLTGVFCYNAALEDDTPLGRRKFRTQGGSAEFAITQHLDWFGICAAPGFLQLWKATGDELWHRAALAIIEYTGQMAGPEPGSSMWGAVPGYQPEILVQSISRQILFGSVGYGNFQGITSAVPAATLTAIFEIRDSFPEVLLFKPQPFSLEPPARSALGKALFHFGSYVNVFR